MNENQIFEAIGEVDDEMLNSVSEYRKQKNTWIKIAGTAATVCVVAAVILAAKTLADNTGITTEAPHDTTAGNPLTTTTVPCGYNCDFCGSALHSDNCTEKNMETYSPETKAMLLSAAEYPDMPRYPVEFSEDFEAQYDAWQNFRNEYRRETPKDYKDSANRFTADSMKVFLTDSGNENKLVSPVNIYFALGLLAESSDTSSRQQILDLFGADSIETLREYCSSMWKTNYSDDGALTTVFANSVWLSDSLNYNMKTLELLSDSYYADSFSGNMSDKAYTNAFQEWLNVKTGGMLENEAKQLEFDPQTVFSLASTVYFRGKWQDEFNPENTQSKIFTTSDGKQVECDFMCRERESYYYWGKNYGAMKMSFDGTAGSEMWVFLPDEGVTTDELIESGEINKLIEDNRFDYPDSKRLIINFQIPKFDTAYTTDLQKGLNKLGVTDVFDGSSADFSPMLENAPEGTALSKVQHSVRVAIDEEGCTASAFTAMMICGAAMPPDDRMDFILDRPFVFVIQSDSNDTLFAGVINNPAN